MRGRQTGLIIANTVVGAGLGFVALKLFAVYTGEHADGLLGQLAFAMGLAGLLSIVADLGFGSAHVKRVSEGRDLGNASTTFAWAKTALAGAFVALVAGAALAASALGVLQETPRFAVAIIAVYFAFLGLRTVYTATFDGRREFAKTQAVVLAEHLVRVPLMVLFAAAFAGAVEGSGPLAGLMRDGGASFSGLLQRHAGELLAACYAAAAVASFLAGAVLFRRGYPWGRFDRGVLRDYWSFGRHIFLAMVVGTVYVNLDKVAITAFWTAEHTGRYFAAQRFSDLISMVPIAVYTVLFPAMSRDLARGDKEAMRASTGAALRHVSMTVVPLVAYIVALAGPLLSLVLTGVFQEAVPTMRLLALYALVSALFYPYATVLHALGKPEVTAKSAIVGTAINAVLNLAFIPAPGTWGLPTLGLAEAGAALATLVAVVAQFVIVRRAVHRLEGRVPEGHVVKHLVAGAAMLLVLSVVPAPFAPTAGNAPAALMVAMLALGGLVYVGVLALLGEFTRRDLEMYLHIADPAAMGRYVAAEVRKRGPGGKEPRGAEEPEPPERP